MQLRDMTIGVFVAEGFEDLEFWVPVMRLREEGATVRIIGVSRETVTGKHCLEATPDVLSSEVDAPELDALVVPGGWAPDKLRRDADVLRLVTEVNAADKIVGFICHAGWVAASAHIIDGMRVTGSRGIKDDLENAGGIWADEPAFRSDNIVWGASSRISPISAANWWLRLSTGGRPPRASLNCTRTKRRSEPSNRLGRGRSVLRCGSCFAC